MEIDPGITNFHEYFFFDQKRILGISLGGKFEEKFELQIDFIKINGVTWHKQHTIYRRHSNISAFRESTNEVAFEFVDDSRNFDPLCSLSMAKIASTINFVVSSSISFTVSMCVPISLTSRASSKLNFFICEINKIIKLPQFDRRNIHFFHSFGSQRCRLSLLSQPNCHKKVLVIETDLSRSVLTFYVFRKRSLVVQSFDLNVIRAK